LFAACTKNQPAEAAYVPSGSCRACHPAIADSYQNVAMARSLYRPAVANIIEDYRAKNQFYHAASERHYRMTERAGRFYQQRYQRDERGREVNLLEVEVSYIIGSGNHARSYLHLSASGELTQLPVTWYSQKRQWGMSPGYDKPRHADFSRAIDHHCMFCHNGYPGLPAGADRYGSEPRFPQQLTHGIDCQRCHGPGSRHIELASSGLRSEEIRAAIVNPRKLAPDRQMDVCQQCHLEVTSAKLPQAVGRFGRAVNSFRPGERLSDYVVHFDKQQDEDRFEIVSAAYRLRKSACFLKSGAKLTCITCHNPHRTPTGDAAVAQFRAACQECHPAPLRAMHPDPATSDCAGCHMPKRRTEDVVHVAMTDHWIQRRKADRDLLAPLAEKEIAYRGSLVFYNSPQLSAGDRELYRGIALAKDGADRRKGIAQLEKAIAAEGVSPVEALIELADAHAAERNPSAAAYYRRALGIDPGLVRVRYSLGRALAQQGDLRAAREQYEQVIREDPALPEAHNNLGTLLAQQGDFARAADSYRTAVRARPGYAEAHSNLARLHADQRRWQHAQAEAEEALRCDPAFAPAFNTLGIIHASQQRMALAIAQFDRAVRLDPEFAEAHYNRGLALQTQGKPEAAAAEYRRTIQIDPRFAPAHLSLGVALGETGRLDAARDEFREALRLRPGYPDAQRNLQMLQDAQRR
jgi:tetratricopeptide (TPR) repeat protein